ncbi:hypothetical protein, variant [Verruconis gallopava]|nr:hypothetical protein, variant [Verruconis gallopava]KIW09266.1 hypothetical protein, variant [Verruconis gallopava]
MAAEGHLDCMFDCGLHFSSLESLYLHIELHHREDNTISGFAVQEGAASPPAQSHQGNSGYTPLGSLGQQTYTSNAHSTVQSHQTVTFFDDVQMEGEHLNQDQTAGEVNEDFVLCSEKDCGELIFVADLNDHLDLHEAQKGSLDDDTSSVPQSDDPSSSSSSSPYPNDAQISSRHDHSSTGRKIKSRSAKDEEIRSHIGRKFLLMFGTDRRGRDRVPSNKAPICTQRLGKAELGPHAFEDRMPSWMYRKLKEGPKITRTRRITRNGGLITHESVEGQTNGVLPILRQLVELDPAVYIAYLCHPYVTQIGKRTWESGFCGFHNTQMVISYIQNSKHPAHTLFPGFIPGILDIQDWIETAWSEGINEHAKEEFGGLRGTRKWIGTLEVDTLFQYLGIPHQIHQFHDTVEVNNQYADQNLLDWVEEYFKDAAMDPKQKVHCTLKPPIYFQRPGHSLTIVGMERMRNGTRNLLVFDPMYQVPTSMLQLIERGRVKELNTKLLRFYRRSQLRLHSYADFEATT